ncbi:Serine/threonine-protein kinase PknD [Paenibacillus plantiphilus]|uniref:Serine/threonine-protein kinase PknD n=1 Tax=Paenibacillus plantiphilus TaxID=2905650 RepID=A0ABN8FPG6_9BACL|nr:serine/threonine-protein kinase [Paenibacillus plantiphilus]CAH1189921.1 Serine/threonine-protein kinase PknD [Paenibacillus plantiphilus]
MRVNVKLEWDEECLGRNTRLLQSYRIKSIVSQSELSIVYTARHGDSGEMRIVKEFFPRALTQRGADRRTVDKPKSSRVRQYEILRELFRQEALLLKEIEHPYIVRYKEHFEENNTLYLVMEYCQGTTLDRLVREGSGQETEGKLPSDLNSRFMRQTFNPIMSALAYLHNEGIIHRDIKPGNIVIDRDGKPKLIDFGSAVRYAECRQFPIMTTSGYSPLELYSEKSQQGPSSDIYSLAATMYFVLTGRPPTDVTERLFEDKLPPLRAHNRNANPALAWIIHWGLALEVKRRCQSLRWFRIAAGLGGWGAGRGERRRQRDGADNV